MNKYDIIIIGAGPAGLIAAHRASELGAKVIVLEKMERAGRKLLITGKGRCNITNDAGMSEFFKHIYPNGKFLKHVFSQFFAKDIVDLLNKNGVETVVERGGRIFPASSKSADVLQALLKSCNKVDIIYHAQVEKILTNENQAVGVQYLKNGTVQQVFANNVIVCTGGNSYPATGSSGDGYKMAKAIGHSINTVFPALVPLETTGGIAERLQGLSLKNVNAVVWINGKKHKEEFGEMLFTHFGLSGPIILTLSRFVVEALLNNHKVEISIDLKPALDEQKLDTRLLRDLNEHGKKHIDNLFKEWLPSKLIPVFIDLTGTNPDKECNQISSKERRKIMLLMKDFRFTVSGYRPFKEAIITAGGVSTAEIDSKTMASKLVNNVYFAGEVIDLDADTGGYNLQIAYSTAWAAAQACMKK